MDRDQAIGALPAPYGDVVRLLDEGLPPTVAAERLGMDLDAAGTLAAVAEGKLAELLADGAAGPIDAGAPSRARPGSGGDR